MTIAEIRKRIAQYYHEEAHETEMRIELLPGHYVPEFHPSRARTVTGNGAIDPIVKSGEPEAALKGVDLIPREPSLPAPVKERRKGFFSRLNRYHIAAAALIVVAGTLAALWQWADASAVDDFWKPIVASRHTVIFCLPADAAGSKVAEAAGIISSTATSQRRTDPTAAQGDLQLFWITRLREKMSYSSDALAMQKISNWLASKGTDSILRLNVLTTLDDLQQGPTVLIGCV